MEEMRSRERVEGSWRREMVIVFVGLEHETVGRKSHECHNNICK